MRCQVETMESLFAFYGFNKIHILGYTNDGLLVDELHSKSKEKEKSIKNTIPEFI